MATARKLAVAVWYLLKKVSTKIPYIEQDLTMKLKKIAENLKQDYIIKIGYKSVKHFIDDKMKILQTDS